jgi:hypothetical protein
LCGMWCESPIILCHDSFIMDESTNSLSGGILLSMTSILSLPVNLNYQQQ